MTCFQKTKKMARKIAVNYAGTQDDFDQYVTLAQAEKISGYPRILLSSLIEENKLRAIKINKVWLTKKYWIDDCIEKTNEWLDQSSEIKKNVETIQNERAGLTKETLAVSSASASRKAENDSGRGDFYLWTSALLFLLFFAVSFGQKSFGNAWFDVKSVSKQAFAGHGAIDRENGRRHVSENAARIDNGNVSVISSMLGELYIAPVMPDEDFTIFLSKNAKSVCGALFMSEIKSYANWMTESLKKKIGNY